MTDASDKPRSAPDMDGLMADLRASESPRWGGRAGGRGRPSLAPAPDGLWATTLQWVVAALVTALLAYFTYAHGGWVPILSYFDLGVHEFGHLVTFWAPDLIVWPAGSVMQVVAPLILAVYFLRRGDRFAVILMLAWAGESLNNVSVYVGDAQAMVLPLFGDDGSGAGHDWHNILTRLDLLESTDAIAGLVRFVSILFFVAAFALAAWWFAQPRLAARRGRGGGRMAAPPPAPTIID